jgi:2-C-methyl-D-erythritol 4-phosphate cytidylyltransferase
MKISVIIAAGGIGKRMGGKVSKQLLKINNRPILYYSIKAFEEVNEVNDIVIVSNNEIIDQVKKIANNFKKIKCIVPGGKERQHSIYNGLLEIDKDKEQIVLIHDGVRPFIEKRIIIETIRESKKNGAAVPGISTKDTIKFSEDGKYFLNTPDRKNYWLIQTPQGFSYALILKAHQEARKTKYLGSDDSSLVEKMGVKPKIILGSQWNIKITTPEDLKLAKFILNKKIILLH